MTNDDACTRTHAVPGQQMRQHPCSSICQALGPVRTGTLCGCTLHYARRFYVTPPVWGKAVMAEGAGGRGWGGGMGRRSRSEKEAGSYFWCGALVQGGHA